MLIRRLELTNFRNYRRLDLELPPGLILLIGENAQGKSNLLEAIYLISTTRSIRASVESELVNWGAASEGAPVARLVATGESRRAGSRRGLVEVEIAIAARSPAAEGSRAGKRLRVNGVHRRASEAVGQIPAVLFATHDMDLVSGPPALRRRYLDITLSQVDPPYLRALQRYSRVLLQRNALLRQIQAGEASPAQLPFWDGELAVHGAYLVSSRARAVFALAELAAEAHRTLSGGREELGLAYEPRLSPKVTRPGEGPGWDSRRAAAASVEEIGDGLRQALAHGHRREVAAGATLSGPHRDDLLFTLDGRPAAAYVSRAQERTAALALRLAEARFLLQRTGEHPVLLLDDVLSELDEGRRLGVLASVNGFDQVVITSVDVDRLDASLLGRAAVFRVREGRLDPPSGPPQERT